MKYSDTKLIVFLKTFSKEEINELEKFLSLPYFKKGRDPLPLLKVLRKFHPEFSSGDFNEEKIFGELYPGSDYEDKRSAHILRNLSSSLLKAVEEFLFVSRVRENKVLKNRTMLKELLDRNLTRYYEQYLQTSYDDLKSDESISGQDYLENFYIERLNTRYYSTVLDFQNLFKYSFKSVELLSVYFLIDLIRTATTKYIIERRNNMKSESNVIDRLLSELNMDEVLKIYENREQYVYLYFNYNIYKCIVNNKDKEFYEKARKIFFENKSRICRYDKNFFYADLLNIILSGYSEDDFELRKEALFLFKSCLKDGAYKISDDDFMQPHFYRNVILTANLLKEFEWADNFIDKYSNELKPEFRDNMKYYSQAIIRCSTGEFEKSLEYASKVKYDLVNFKVDLKILMLKIFYELKLTEQAYSLTDTFKHYLKNHKEMNPEIKEAHFNYLKYYLMLLKMNLNFNSASVGLLKDQLKSEKLIMQRKWITEKLDKLECQ